MILENVFSWSKSRDEQFRECPRQYYFDKYASWGGWDRQAPAEQRLAYVLKNLKNRWAWKGETVHHEIERVLKSLRAGRPVPVEEAVRALTETMRRDWRSSKNGKYREDPKKAVGLFEHEYDKRLSDAVWQDLHDSSVACLRHFYDSPLYAELLKEDPKGWLVIEDLESFDHAGAKIFVKLDFARQKDGRIEIYDWKTGKSDAQAASVQMGVYAMYAVRRWGVPIEGIRAAVVNLSEPVPRAEDCPITAPLVEDTERFIEQSIRGMRELLEDVERNVPKPREAFAFTKNVRLCDFCNFKKICERFATQETQKE